MKAIIARYTPSNPETGVRPSEGAGDGGRDEERQNGLYPERRRNGSVVYVVVVLAERDERSEQVDQYEVQRHQPAGFQADSRSTTMRRATANSPRVTRSIHWLLIGDSDTIDRAHDRTGKDLPAIGRASVPGSRSLLPVRRYRGMVTEHGSPPATRVLAGTNTGPPPCAAQWWSDLLGTRRRVLLPIRMEALVLASDGVSARRFDRHRRIHGLRFETCRRMWPWGHAAIGYLLFSMDTRLRYGRRPGGPATILLFFGTQFPDLVDKPLAWTLPLLPSG